MNISKDLIEEGAVIRNYKNTELGEIRILANIEKKLLETKERLEINEFVPLYKNEPIKSFIEETSKNIEIYREQLRNIIIDKIDELVSKYKIDSELSNKEIDKIFKELEQKSKVPSYWYSLSLRFSQRECRIIDKQTKAFLLCADVTIIKQIIEDTFGNTTVKELKEQADKDWEKIEDIINNVDMFNMGVKRINQYSCKVINFPLRGDEELEIEEALEFLQCINNESEVVKKQFQNNYEKIKELVEKEKLQVNIKQLDRDWYEVRDNNSNQLICFEHAGKIIKNLKELIRKKEKTSYQDNTENKD